MNKADFKNFHRLSCNKELKFWNKIIDWQNEDDLNNLIRFFSYELSNSKNDIDTLQEKAYAICQDLKLLKNKTNANSQIFNFLQFIFSREILIVTTSQKLFNYSFDWICNSISDEVSTSTYREYDAGKLQDFILSKNTFIKKNIQEEFVIWTKCLFYYSRNTGGLNDLCELYLEKYFPYLLEIIKCEYWCIGAIIQISNWSEQHIKKEIDEKCKRIIFENYQKCFNPKTKKEIAFFFSSTINNYTSLSRNEWCLIVENEYSEFLCGHEPMQLFLNKHIYNFSYEHFEELIVNIKIYHNYLDKHNLNAVMLSYELSKIYSIFEPILNQLALSGKIDLANKVIGAFFKISNSDLIDSKIIYILPNSNDGVAYCFNYQTFYSETNTVKNLPVLIDKKNKFLSLTETFHNVLEFKFEEPKIHGKPMPEESNDYCEIIKNHFHFDILRFHPNIENLSGMYLMFGVSLPIQSIIAKELNITIPSVHSFSNPEKQRRISNVFIWQGDTQLSEIECNALSDLFDKNNINVSLHKCNKSCKEIFLENFFNNEYDLVWISAHGEFDHYEANKSYLDLGNDIKITRDELISKKNDIEGRRLVVLNLCDGATTFLFKNPLSIGIGTTIINSKQSVMAHSWPINNYAALIFGVLIAISLSKNSSYEKAYSSSIDSFYKGKDLLIKIMHDNNIINDVIERIENTNIKFQDFYYWGSLEYLI